MAKAKDAVDGLMGGLAAGLVGGFSLAIALNPSPDDFLIRVMVGAVGMYGWLCVLIESGRRGQDQIGAEDDG